MGVELEIEVAGVDHEEDDSRAAGQGGDVGRRRILGKDVEAGGEYNTADCEGEETGGRLGDGLVEELFGALEATEEETHAHDEEEIGENTSNKGSLNDDDFVLG